MRVNNRLTLLTPQGHNSEMFSTVSHWHQTLVTPSGYVSFIGYPPLCIPLSYSLTMLLEYLPNKLLAQNHFFSMEQKIKTPSSYNLLWDSFANLQKYIWLNVHYSYILYN